MISHRINKQPDSIRAITNGIYPPHTQSHLLRILPLSLFLTRSHLARVFRALTHIWLLDYVQASVLADLMRTVALQIDQYPIETPGSPGSTIGTLGEVVLVAQLVLAAVELFLGCLFQAVSHGLQYDAHPAIERGQMRLP